MLPMPLPPRSLQSRVFGLLAGLVVALVPALAAADTGAPLPQGNAPDVNAAPQDAPPQAGDGYADTDPSALTDFRPALDPHGQWVQDPNYGTIWVPNAAEVGSDFAPYQTAGQWAVDDSGDWMWQSDYDWGYVPFHYGRWVWAGGYWGWIPGRTYAPAWVSWRVGDGGYLGWAPLPPTWYWSDGYAVGLWTVPWAAYCFVPTGAAFYPGVGHYVVHDPGLVRAAGAATRPYHPATATVGSHPGSGTHAPQHMSPSFGEAHIPPSAIPQQRAAADPRATAYATPSGHAPQRTGRTFGSGMTQRRTDAWHNSYDRASAGRQAAAEASVSRAPAYRSAPAYRAAPTFRSGYRAPAYYSGARGAAPSYSYRPSVSRPSAPASRPAPSYHPSGGGSHAGGHRR
jgi:hypothetical protein